MHLMNYIDSFHVQRNMLSEMKQNNHLFNLTKIYEQIDYNEDLKHSNVVTQGNFMWEGGIKDTSVQFVPSKQGRFYVSWVPRCSTTK